MATQLHDAREAARLEALAGYGILDTLPEGAFDDITRLASHICEAPIALISLVDAERQWFKSRVGLDAPQTPRDQAFCAHALGQPGHLTEAEFAAIRQHPVMGAAIVGAVPGFEAALGAVRHHHERWDGRGYPDGLRGEACPLPARLLAVADSFSAMTTDRPYRQGMDPARARDILRAGAGTQWDSACVEAFLRARQVRRARTLGREAE